MTQAVSSPPENELLKRFLKYQELQQQAILQRDVPAANRHMLKVIAVGDLLAATSRGKDALEALIYSPRPYVRLRAGQWVLKWNPRIAIPVLAQIMIEDFRQNLSVDERLELRASAKETLYGHFGIRSFDRNDLIKPLQAYGVALPYRDHDQWQ